MRSGARVVILTGIKWIFLTLAFSAAALSPKARLLILVMPASFLGRTVEMIASPTDANSTSNSTKSL
jgi:hypothetical protein